MLDKSAPTQTLYKKNHVYSLRYKPEHKFAEQYQNIGVMLDVMTLKSGGYYCQTAHLAAQQWFLSLGVPMDGLYGFSVYDDQGFARSRIGHVKTGLYGAVYDFTPTTPNPGENLRSLAFDENVYANDVQNLKTTSENNYATELLKKFANTDTLIFIILLLSAMGIGKSVQLIIAQLRKNSVGTDSNLTTEIKQIVPNNELAMRGLTSALIHLFNMLISDEYMNSKSNTSYNILRECMQLTTAPATMQAKFYTAAPINPEVHTLLQLTGLTRDKSVPLDTKALDTLMHKLNENTSQRRQLFVDMLAQLNKVASDLEKEYKVKQNAVAKSVKKLQKQLAKTRRAENSIYGPYGKLLTTAKLMHEDRLSEIRRQTTADYLTIKHNLDTQIQLLEQLTIQIKLIPVNTKNMSKVLKLIAAAQDKRK